MTKASGWGVRTVVALTIVMVQAAICAERTWTDSSGKFSIDAELVEVDGKTVVLKKADGEEVKVPLDRLSTRDQLFLKRQANETPEQGDDEVPADGDRETAVTDITEQFYRDLRTQERTAAAELLTATAKAAAAKGKSPLGDLPSPSSGSRSILVGKADVDEKTAEVPVKVRAGGKMHDTKLHLRLEDDTWRVFAISATFPDGEKTIDFEAEPAPPAGVPAGGSIEDLVGKPFALQGYTLSGQPVDIAQLKGKVVLVDFWATWCGPCVAEIPNILENYKKYNQAGFEVIAVSLDSDMEALAEFVAKEQPPWIVLADKHPQNQNSMASAYGIRGIPAFVLVGADGNVITVNCRGPRLGQELAKIFGQ